ncbi:MAG TPA: hypothetical protein VNZ45_13620 [Bacteroidia bacterium]|jgi:hypothetical protein|nr:hypothetical protein [Bacteroidia bacterium]
MNKLGTLVLSTVLASSLISCGSSDKKSDSNDQTNAQSMVNQAEAIKAAAGIDTKGTEDTYAAKMKERRAKGDTLAMPYADLQKYLPQSLDGYTAEKPDGASVNMGRTSYSSANIRFKKDNGDWVKVTVIDYNQAYNLYATASMVWKMSVSMDSPDKKMNSIKLDNTEGGLEAYNKKNKEAKITLGVGSRFWIDVEASNQNDLGMVESVAKSLDLSKMASM